VVVQAAVLLYLLLLSFDFWVLIRNILDVCWSSYLVRVDGRV
jgi:hypothetical protein